MGWAALCVSRGKSSTAVAHLAGPTGMSTGQIVERPPQLQTLVAGATGRLEGPYCRRPGVGDAGCYQKQELEEGSTRNFREGFTGTGVQAVHFHPTVRPITDQGWRRALNRFGPVQQFFYLLPPESGTHRDLRDIHEALVADVSRSHRNWARRLTIPVGYD